MSILKKDIENAENNRLKSNDKFSYLAYNTELVTLKFADKRFDEFVKQLKEEWFDSPFALRSIDSLVEEFNRPQLLKSTNESQISIQKKGEKNG